MKTGTTSTPIQSSEHRVMFVQPFGLISPASGGSRIMRSLLNGQSFSMLSVDSGINKDLPPDWIEEVHLPLRFSLGKLDRSRFANVGSYLEIPGRMLFARRLELLMNKWKPTTVHILPHCPNDFHIAWRLARQQGLRVVMSVHDDLRATISPENPFIRESDSKLGEIWKDADHVFVISQEMGIEYSARYGEREFEIVTDGVQQIAPKPLEIVPRRLHVYFMGSFHYTYGKNFKTLSLALAEFKRKNGDFDVRLTLRCGQLPADLHLGFEVEVLPFSDQTAVLEDMAHADLLYMPLPFGEANETFVRYSLSTKMVSYLGSGTPIFYHGPADAAANRLLLVNRAAFISNTLDPNEVVSHFSAVTDPQQRNLICSNALKLADNSFRLTDLRERFRKGILGI